MKAWRIALIASACLVAGVGISSAQGPSPQAQVAALPAPYNAANYEAGQRAFAQCADCHALEAGVAKLGPNLHGVIGRRAGSVADYDYTPALAQAGFSWDAAHLDAWLKDPAGYLPGNEMLADGVTDDTQRRDLIAYLMIASR